MNTRRGMTLIELLVVIGIITTLAAVTIPVMLPQIEARKMREAARGVSTFLATARATAIETGRPAGVIFARMDNDDLASMNLFLAEQPPVFAGLDTNATATFSSVDNSAKTMTAAFSSASPAGMVNVGDRVKFNHQGHVYIIIGGDCTNSINVRTENPQANIPWQNGMAASYQITRRPVSGSGAPYQLPEGVVVDLGSTGVGAGVFNNQRASGGPVPPPVIVMFSPSGNVDSIFRQHQGNVIQERMNGTLFVLLGTPERVAGGTNWNEPTNFWVAVQPNGQAKAAEVIGGAGDLATSRAFARDRGALGGK